MTEGPSEVFQNMLQIYLWHNTFKHNGREQYMNQVCVCFHLSSDQNSSVLQTGVVSGSSPFFSWSVNADVSMQHIYFDQFAPLKCVMSWFTTGLWVQTSSEKKIRLMRFVVLLVWKTYSSLSISRPPWTFFCPGVFSPHHSLVLYKTSYPAYFNTLCVQ